MTAIRVGKNYFIFIEKIKNKCIFLNIFSTVDRGNQQTSGWNMKTHMFMSDNFMSSKSMIVNQGNKFLLT